jgi:NAD(P)H-dependent FMN reductase
MRRQDLRADGLVIATAVRTASGSALIMTVLDALTCPIGDDS